MMPGMDGLEVLRRIKELDPDAQVIMLTALDTARTALIAKEAGAFDYLTKPFDVNEIRLRVERAFEKNDLAREVRRLQEEVGRRYGVESIVGGSKPMLELFRAVRVVATKKSTVLITGESGTGKELVARAIHFNSDRSSGPFVVVNCAALPDSLIESELFGHERGAFTTAYQRRVGRFELADHGTLLLDEIGELKPALQAKLLRVIETETFCRLGGTREIKVDVRILAATNRDLERAVLSGEFREDLFYRLNVISLALPPLRKRKEDIPLLLSHFLRLKAKEGDLPLRLLSPEVVDCLQAYPWPGNIRELENLVERLTVLSPRETVTIEDLPAKFRQNRESLLLEDETGKPLGEAVDQLERGLILDALQKSGFNQTKAATVLGTTRRVLRYKIEKLQINDKGPVELVTKLSR
jgi:DNA-binding NtrC family response regulator